jgi:DNA-binding NtrC family response regulator
VHPPVWLWTRESEWRRLLTELLQQAFTVRQCSGVARVWNDLLAGETGVFVVDLTHLTTLGLADRSRLCSLSYLVPVLLLVDDPAVADVALTDAGHCSVLFEPFNDLDRLLSATLELRQLTAPLGTHALSTF